MSELGTVVDLTPPAAKEAVVARVNEHAAKLKDFDGSLRSAGERQELIERLTASMQEEIKALKTQERVTWSAAGNASDLDHRFLRADGMVQVADKEISERFLGVEVKHRAAGLLTADRGVTHEHERLIQAYRRYALAKVMSARGWAGANDLLPRYTAEFLRAARSLPGRVGDQLRAMLADEASYQRVLNGASGSGAEMISNPTIAAIRKPLLLARRVAGLIPSQPVTAPTFKQSHATGHGLARKRGATADDPARFRRHRQHPRARSDYARTRRKAHGRVLISSKALCDAGRGARRRNRRHRSRARGTARILCEPSRQAARGRAAQASHAPRHRNDKRVRVCQRYRELLASLRPSRAG
jgi:hypothetical protein